MTTSEWVLWILLVCTLIVCLLAEYKIARQNDELEDEQDYSEWLERRLYNKTYSGTYVKERDQHVLEYRQKLWNEYYVEAGWEKEAADA